MVGTTSKVASGGSAVGHQNSGSLAQGSISGGASRFGNRTKKKNGLGGGPSAMFSGSRLSGGSSMRGSSGAGAVQTGGAIRVLVEGQDLTPLSLLNDHESLAVRNSPTASGKNQRDINASLNGSMIFASTNGIRSSFKAGNAPLGVDIHIDNNNDSLHDSSDSNINRDKLNNSGSNNANNNANNNNNSGVNSGGKNPNKLHFETKEDGLPAAPPVHGEREEQHLHVSTSPIARKSVDPRSPSLRDQRQVQQAMGERGQLNLQEVIVKMLVETPTTTLFQLTGSCVSAESAEHKLVTDRNQKYDEMCEGRESSDLYTSRPTQTLNQDVKNTEISTLAPPVQDSGCQVTSWDIFDNSTTTAAGMHELGLEDDLNVVEGAAKGAILDSNGHSIGDDIGQPIGIGAAQSSDATRTESAPLGDEGVLGATIAAQRHMQIEKLVSVSMASPGCLLPIEEAGAPASEKAAEGGKQSPPIMSPGSPMSPSLQPTQIDDSEGFVSNQLLMDTLRTLERGVQQNVFHEKHMLYRAVPLADSAYLEEKMNGETTAQQKQLLMSQEEENAEGSIQDLNAKEGMEDEEEASGEAESSEEQQNGKDKNQKQAQVSPETVPTSGEDAQSPEATTTATSTTIDSAREGNKNSLMMGNSEYTVDGEEEEEEESIIENPALQLLWKFQCPETQGRTVSSMSWNRLNEDLLAVAYCEFDFDAQQDGGLILLWTLKNPEYPERIIRCDAGVCSVDFSGENPSLLAAGMYDGTVAIYDLHREGPNADKPVLDSSRLATQHNDAVWQVKWVNKNERGEVLVSLSSDGRVTEWYLKKGLASTDLMVLKRVHVPTELGGHGEGIISRTASGLSLDFPANGSGIYYVGTEDGTLHRCSCSYNEQYLETYFGHCGPVYKLRCSPFWQEAFLTCSADWSIKLWEPEHDQALLQFQSVDLADVVYDVAWSTSQSTVFGSVAGDGRIEIWDLSKNTLDPVITGFIDDSAERRAMLRRSNSVSAVPPPDPPTASLEHSKTKQQKQQHQDQRSKGDHARAASSGHRGDGGSFFSSIAFAGNVPIVVAGASNGAINVYRIRGLDQTHTSAQDAAEVLRTIVYQNQQK